MADEKQTAEEMPLFDETKEAGAGLPEAPELESAEPVGGQVITPDEGFVADLEKAAQYAPRVVDAMRKILVAVAYPGDWSDHDGSACLSSAGSERYLAHFPVRFTNWTREKVEWTDEEGPAYRWIYRALASWKGRQVMCEGRYSTRSPFLGKAHGEFRDLKDIDEGDIMAAAQHICQGAGIKTLLGLRGIPTDELIRLGVDEGKIERVDRSKGSKGGATGDEKVQQAEVRTMLMAMADQDEKKAKDILEELTAFEKDGKNVPGLRTVAKLKGRRLEVTLDKTIKKYEEWKKSQ